MKTTDALLAAARLCGLPEEAARLCGKVSQSFDCEALSQSFFSLSGKRRIPKDASAPAARLGYFPHGFYPERTFFTPAKALFDAAGIPRETGFLAALLSFSDTTRSIYQTFGLPDAVLSPSLAEIGKNARAFQTSHGFYGVDDYVWLCCFLIPELFSVGSLQFRLCGFPYADVSVGGAVVRRGEAVIQTHVPDGADISRPALRNAYTVASMLFGTNIFLVDSWLLYPEHRQMLPSDSAIRGFMDDFAIIDRNETDDYEGLFRIFGRRGCYRYDSLPQDTALRRAYAERVKRRLPIGSAVGVMRHNP